MNINENLEDLKKEVRASNFYSVNKSFDKLFSLGFYKEIFVLYKIFKCLIENKITWNDFTKTFREINKDKRFRHICLAFEIIRIKKIEKKFSFFKHVYYSFDAENAKRVINYFEFRKRAKAYYRRNSFQFRKLNNLEKDFEKET